MQHYTLPTSIEINGTPFKITDNGDFRMVFSCFTILNSLELSETERVLGALLTFYEDFPDFESIVMWEDKEEAVKKMYEFFNCGDDIQSNTSNLKLIDWDKDATLICSAVNTVANKEIRAEEYLHWWTFVSYYMGIGECALSNIINIRYKRAKGKKLEKYERQFINENPQYFKIDTRSNEEKEMDAYFRSLWDGEG